MRTEDHPLEYLDFSAVIPEGQYGAGRMTIWDAGTFEEEMIAEDEWKLALQGGVLRGNYHLVRTGPALRQGGVARSSARLQAPGAGGPDAALPAAAADAGELLDEVPSTTRPGPSS